MLATFYSILFKFQVRNAEAAWRDTRKQLRKDHRWAMVDALEREEKEKLFDDHIKELARKNKDMFHKLLKENNVSSYLCDVSIY